MKRFIIFVAAVAMLACGLNAGAQGRNEINVFMGGLNGTYAALEDGGVYHNDLYSLYEPEYSIECFPTFTVDFNHKLLKWLGIGIQTNYTYLSGTSSYRTGNPAVTKIDQRVVSVLPQAKFYIPSPRHFRLYGKAGAGVNLSFGKAIAGKQVSFAWDVVPIGCEWGGQTVYGTAEICVGNVIAGGRIGIGFRF